MFIGVFFVYMNKTSEIIKFLYEIGTLRKIARSHRQNLYTDDLSDNIASHSYRVTMIGYVLSILEKVDTNKVIKMCLLHDTDETRSNDQNWVHKKYVKVFEDEIQLDQFKFAGKYRDFENIKDEYSKRKSKESLVAKDADMLDQILLLKEYAWAGNHEAERWLTSRQEDFLSTKSAKKLYKEIKKQKPSDWWSNNWTNKRR